MHKPKIFQLKFKIKILKYCGVLNMKYLCKWKSKWVPEEQYPWEDLRKQKELEPDEPFPRARKVTWKRKKK